MLTSVFEISSRLNISTISFMDKGIGPLGSYMGSMFTLNAIHGIYNPAQRSTAKAANKTHTSTTRLLPLGHLRKQLWQAPSSVATSLASRSSSGVRSPSVAIVEQTQKVAKPVKPRL